MGNRAILAFEDKKKRDHASIGIYLHWNGGRDSVEGFLQVAKAYGLRSGDYGIARLTQIIGNFIGGTLSLGVGVVKRMDSSDNGIYWIDEHFDIVGREFAPDNEQNTYSLYDMTDEVKQKNDSHFSTLIQND
tara:strand:- start:755 stop:1150 length:396 start_codon:yes stop_codon:yes gene_type:complete